MNNFQSPKLKLISNVSFKLSILTNRSVRSPEHPLYQYPGRSCTVLPIQDWDALWRQR